MGHENKRIFCENIIKKETNKTKYTDNDLPTKIDPKLQNTSKIQVLIMILHKGVHKNIQEGFVKFQKNFITSILIRAIVRKNVWS